MSVLGGLVRVIRLNRVNYSVALDQQKAILAATRTLKYPQVHPVGVKGPVGSLYLLHVLRDMYE